MVSLTSERMQAQINSWELVQDRRREFLECYLLMTENMLTAIEAVEFKDPDWISNLLHHFASYYFNALEAYESASSTTPAVWRQVFDAAQIPEIKTIQNLMLGINAHINYDLVFTLCDLLEPEWEKASPDHLELRYADHCHVNDVIHRSIDAVQDSIIEPQDPIMQTIDEVLGPVDEWVVSLMITRWRDAVWENAVALIKTTDPVARAQKASQIEQEAINRAGIILKLS